MDTLPQNIADPLEILIYISIVLILIIGIFLIKLLLDTSNLVKSMQDFVKVTQAELEPTIKEIQGTLTNINNISSNVNDQINNINSGLQKGGYFLSDHAVKSYKKLKVVGAQTKDILVSTVKAFLKK